MTVTNSISYSPNGNPGASASGISWSTSSGATGGGNIFSLLRQLVAKNRMAIAQQQGQFAIMAGQYANAAGEAEKDSWQEDASKYRTMASQALVGAVISCVALAVTVGTVAAKGIVDWRATGQKANLDDALTRIDQVAPGAGLNGEPMPRRTVSDFIRMARQPIREFAAAPADLPDLKATIKMAMGTVDSQSQVLAGRIELVGSLTDGSQRLGSAANDTRAAIEKAAAVEAKAEAAAHSALSDCSHDVNESIRKTLDDRQQSLGQLNQTLLSNYRAYLNAVNQPF